MSMVVCACGCGTEFSAQDSQGRLRRFANGHNARLSPSQRIELFWSRVSVSDDHDSCWPWTSLMIHGYGRVAYRMTGRGWTLAHRFAWEAANEPIPDELFVLHHCDNPPCCNPNHLFLGTALINAADMRSKGRSAVGDKNGTHTHPDRVARGDRHGSRTHPEAYIGRPRIHPVMTRNEISDLLARIHQLAKGVSS